MQVKKIVYMTYRCEKQKKERDSIVNNNKCIIQYIYLFIYKYFSSHYVFS